MLTATSFAQSERLFFRRLSKLKFDPACFYDIGASNGTWSSIMADYFPDARFEMFEPLSGQRADYDEVLAHHLGLHPGLRMHRVALSNLNGQADFWNEPNGFGSSLLTKNVPASEKVEVPVRRLDDYAHELELPPPDVIKVDVQGGELRVLEGGRNTFAHARILHLETWLRRGYGGETPLLHELIDALRPMDFLLVDIGDFWRHDSEELYSVDAFFAHRSLIDELRANGAGFPWAPNWTP
ncbi:MAG: FkbM family methyltransferase [Phycisphaerales bacterium]|nr:FkbM family methyltransferase [Phycisphaerales bacterium]